MTETFLASVPDPDPDNTEVLSTVATLRRQLAGLLDQIDTASIPAPDRRNPPGHRHPGLEWNPAGRTVVRTLDDDEVGTVFLEPEGWGGDWTALSPGMARRLAMALIAAADHVDQRAVGIPTITIARSAR